MGRHEPVTDWKTDFDHTDDAWAADPYAIWDELRGTCPVAHTERYGGVWLPTRFDDVAAIAYDTAPELFVADDIGNSHEAGDGTVRAELEQKARLAVANCPEHAITIEES